MALIECVECGRQVSSKALSCPQCGAPQPKPVSAPELFRPVTGAAYAPTNLSEAIREELLGNAKIGLWLKFRWAFFILFLVSAWYTNPQHPDPMCALLSIAWGIFVLRNWCKRCTVRMILNQGQVSQNTTRLYLQALWSFFWRSLCAGLGVGLAAGILVNAPQDKALVAFAIPMVWFCLSLFALDVPFWILRTIRSKIEAEHSRASITVPNIVSAPYADTHSSKVLGESQKSLKELRSQLENETAEHANNIPTIPENSRQKSPGQTNSLMSSDITRPSVPPPTHEEWIRQVREAEIAVAAIEKRDGRTSILWRCNLDRMRLNPPKRFSPSRKGWLLGRVIHRVFPQILDGLIMRDWRAGRPPRLPAFPGQKIVEDFLEKIGAKS